MSRRVCNLWLINWLSWTVKRPWVKLTTVPILRSDEEGTGKTRIADLMRDVMGQKNYVKPATVDEPQRNFNEHLFATTKLMVLDEANKGNSKSAAGAFSDPNPPRSCSRASQMTAAAVAAAAAGTVTAVTDVTAAAAASPTRYERTLRNCARDLSDFAGCTEPGAWDEGSASGRASTVPRRRNKPCGSWPGCCATRPPTRASGTRLACTHVAAWKAYGISVEQSVLDDLSLLTREMWRPATLFPGFIIILL
jgi:hypothetical protein